MSNNVPWLKNGCPIHTDMRIPVLCDECPCDTPYNPLYIPSWGAVFPYYDSVESGDSLDAMNMKAFTPEASWEVYACCTTGDCADYNMWYNYNCRTDEWYFPPIYKCDDYLESGSFLYYYWGQGSTSADAGYRGFVQRLLPGYVINQGYFFIRMSTNGPEVYDDGGTPEQSLFEFLNLPEGMLGFFDSPSTRIPVKPDYRYHYKLNGTMTGDTYGEGYVKFEYPNDPLGNAYPIKRPDSPPYEGATAVDIKCSVYNALEEYLFSRTETCILPRWESGVCVTSSDVKYYVIGICTFSEVDCKGCLLGVSAVVKARKAGQEPKSGCRNKIAASEMLTVIAGPFDNRGDADDFLEANYDDIIADLESACTTTAYYGIHVKGRKETDQANGNASCYYGFALPYVWSCEQIRNYTDNPSEFIDDYKYDPQAQGFVPTWAIAAGPFDSYAEAVAAIKTYSISCQHYGVSECEINPAYPDLPKEAIYCITMFKAEAYSGVSCVGSTPNIGGGGCAGGGSRNSVSLIGEDASCYQHFP